MRPRYVMIGLAAAAASLIPMACGDDDGGDSGSSNTTQAAAATLPSTVEDATITIEGFAFTVLPAKAGMITVNNKDSADHTVTADDGSFTVTIPAQSTGTFEVSSAGTFAFHCNFHPTMTGELVVT